MRRDLIGRIAITLGALVVYRAGTFIAAPGVDPSSWIEFLGQRISDPFWLLY